MALRKTHKQFVEEVEKAVGLDYKVLSRYINSRTKIKMKHNIDSCGYEYYVKPNDFKTGNRCPKCAGRCKSTESFKKEVYDLVGDEYDVIGEYVNTATKIKMKHNECGHEYNVQAGSFLGGTRCPECQHPSRRKTTEEFAKEVYMNTGGEYTVLGEYITNRNKILMRHNKCGYEYSIKPVVFNRGIRCFECYGSKKKSTEMFKQKVFELTKGEYTVLGDYKGNKKGILLKHNDCNKNFFIKPCNFYSGGRCLHCKESKGEKKVKTFLECNYVSYESQYRFDNCRNVNPLPFDFAIFNSENSLECLIEYDGKQHFKPVRFGGVSQEKAEENFITTQKNDKTKTQYCKENNIPLIRIPYWDFENIETILEKELTALGIIREESIESILV